MGLRHRGYGRAEELANDAATGGATWANGSLASRVLEENLPTASFGSARGLGEDSWAGAPEDSHHDEQDRALGREPAFETRTGLDESRGLTRGLQQRASMDLEEAAGARKHDVRMLGRLVQQRRTQHRTVARQVALSEEVEDRQVDAAARVWGKGLEFDDVREVLGGGESDAASLRKRAEALGQRAGAEYVGYLPQGRGGGDGRQARSGSSDADRRSAAGGAVRSGRRQRRSRASNGQKGPQGLA